MKYRKPLTEEQKEQKRIRENKYYHANKLVRKRKPLTEEQKIKADIYKKKHYEKNYIENKERAKKNYIENKEKKIEYRKEYYQINKEKIKKITKEYLNNPINKKNINNKRNIKTKMRRSTDPLFKLSSNIRSMIYNILKKRSVKKNTKTEQILNCTFEQFKEHIEKQFEPWMNWDNYGNPKDKIFEPNKTWDVDHVIPSSSALTEEDIIKLNHYTNLKPLCSYQNRFVKRDN